MNKTEKLGLCLFLLSLLGLTIKAIEYGGPLPYPSWTKLGIGIVGLAMFLLGGKNA